jgi:hypothetical protein
VKMAVPATVIVRDDVVALPLTHLDAPAPGRRWVLVELEEADVDAIWQVGRTAWIDAPSEADVPFDAYARETGDRPIQRRHGVAVLARQQAAVAQLTHLWAFFQRIAPELAGKAKAG